MIGLLAGRFKARLAPLGSDAYLLPIFSLTAASDGTPPPLMLAGPGEGLAYPPTIFCWKAEAVSSKFLDKSGLLSARVAPPAWLLF